MDFKEFQGIGGISSNVLVLQCILKVFQGNLSSRDLHNFAQLCTTLHNFAQICTNLHKFAYLCKTLHNFEHYNIHACILRHSENNFCDRFNPPHQGKYVDRFGWPPEKNQNSIFKLEPAWKWPSMWCSAQKSTFRTNWILTYKGSSNILKVIS